MTESPCQPRLRFMHGLRRPSLLAALAVVVLAACSTTPPPTDDPAAIPTTRPTPRHVTKVLTFMEENHSLQQTRAGMPYTNQLAEEYGYATHWTALTHPSLPNYLAMAGGSTNDITDDDSPKDHAVGGPNVFGLF
jgi:phosphatidylinositol-3-phosphatase